MATESNVRQQSGVRTYRGRTLEEILPQIRAELGADAVILREREGLVGGVGGFFAQRFIEVEARRGDGQSIDIYDDSPEDDARALPFGDEDEPEVTERKALLPPEPVDLRAARSTSPEEPADLTGRRTAPVDEPVERAQPQPFVPPSVQRPATPPPVEPPMPTSPRFETGVFMDRLREASAVLPDEEPIDEAPPAPVQKPEPREPEPLAPPAASTVGTPVEPPAPAPTSRPKPAGRRQARSRPARPVKPAKPVRPKPKAAPKASEGWTAEMDALPLAVAPEPEIIDEQPTTTFEATTQPVQSTAPVPAPVQQRMPAPRPAPTHAPAPASAAPPPAHADPTRLRPRSLGVGLPTGEPRPAAHATAPTPPPSSAPRVPRPAAPMPLDVRRTAHDHKLLHALSRLLGGRFRQSVVPRAAPAQALDQVAATALATELSTRGASQAWTSQLISTASAHGSPLAGSLRAAAEAEVARRILAAPALPATGAAVAFIGAGGSGKTRCTAALASAYRHGSTLGVTVIAVDNPDGARELRRLLDDDDVPVLSLSGERAAKAVREARVGGFVIVDTPAVTPTDAAQVESLGAVLESLELDAKYVALPATLGPQAARRALASFGRLHPSAVAITHVDETEQIAVAMEIAISHRIPLAYLHSGTDHRTALSAVDAPAIAQQLLAT